MPPALPAKSPRPDFRHGDCLIAVSASGTTPYAVGALQEAARRGVKTIAIANNEGSRLLELADAPSCLPRRPK